MKWTSLTHHRAGTTFVLVFFLVFAALGGLLAAQAMRVYDGIDGRADATQGRAVPLDYLAGAARRADAAEGLRLVPLADGEAALLARENGIDWLYFCRDGYLYKQNAAKNAATAERLCAAGSLRLRAIGGLIRADYAAPDGSRETLLLAARAAGAGGAP